MVCVQCPGEVQGRQVTGMGGVLVLGIDGGGGGDGVEGVAEVVRGGGRRRYRRWGAAAARARSLGREAGVGTRTGIRGVRAVEHMLEI
jgi:hypothetical protein